MMIVLRLKEMVLFYSLCFFSVLQAYPHKQVYHLRRLLQVLI
ncbi:MAG: hypothetical protein RLZZ557_167, partial [Bacteroidota bacterium]